MKLLNRVVAIAVMGVLAVGGPVLVLGATPSPSEPVGPVAVAPEEWTATGPMIEARSGGTATRLLDGRVLVAGGYNLSDLPVTSTELYDPASGTWSTSEDMLAPRVSHTATLLADGRVLVAGGYDGIVGTASAELYDPSSGTR